MKKILVSLSILFLLVSCKKEVTELPPPTQTGANTFGAKVNGSLWVPAGFGAMPTNDILYAHFVPGRDLYIEARNFASSPNETEFRLFIKSVTEPGTYPFNTATPGYPDISASYAYYVKRNISPENEWITSDQFTGSITFTKIDTVNRFVSGTFQFSAASMYTDPVPLSVTEGRFDVGYD